MQSVSKYLIDSIRAIQSSGLSRLTAVETFPLYYSICMHRVSYKPKFHNEVLLRPVQFKQKTQNIYLWHIMRSFCLQNDITNASTKSF